MEKHLPVIPEKRYFTISEVGSLCGVKPHVLRYWEQEFAQLRPTKRRGNRRYYQLYEVQLIRKIRELLYEQGFTIAGARIKLQELVQSVPDSDAVVETTQKQPDLLAKTERENSSALANLDGTAGLSSFPIKKSGNLVNPSNPGDLGKSSESEESSLGKVRPLLHQVRDELMDIRDLLAPLA